MSDCTDNMTQRTLLRMPAARTRQGGVSLIEVMVAILITSLGVLAMAGLLATSARFGKTAEFRSVATLLAADMADRIRANRAGVNSYSLPNTSLTTAAPAEGTCATAGACTAAEIAAIDMAEWEAALFNNLPGGTGHIGTTVPNDGMFDIWVIWEDPEALGVAFSDNAGGNKGCPPNFTTASGTTPRCMFFRVGL
ncbi:type IV pilus modification protein PilV [Ideonella sp.]|uniref:type IV pilus modification protein PilV n=1 Tax=Ideonella sp. TaxID=1929293 RepID=UPI003BB5B8E1